MHIGSGTADVNDEQVPDMPIEQLGGLHHRARSGHDGPLHEATDFLHAGRMDDVFLENLLYGPPCR